MSETVWMVRRSIASHPGWARYFSSATARTVTGRISAGGAEAGWARARRASTPPTSTVKATRNPSIGACLTIRSGEGIVSRIFAPDVFHEPGGLAGHVRPQEARHHRQRHVDARGDARGGNEIAVVHPARPALPLHTRALLHHPVPRDLVGGRGPAVHEAGAREQGRAGAHGGGDGGTAAGRGGGLEQRGVAHRLARAEAAGDQQHVVGGRGPAGGGGARGRAPPP